MLAQDWGAHFGRPAPHAAPRHAHKHGPGSQTCLRRHPEEAGGTVGDRAEEAAAGGTVKKENEKSALRLLKFDTVAANVAGVPAQSAGVYGVTARENPLAPLDS